MQIWLKIEKFIFNCLNANKYHFMASTFIIGITGGSGSGKTTIAAYLASYLQSLSKNKTVSLLNLDRYIAYWLQDKDLYMKTPQSLQGLPLFDHPSAFDIELLRSNIMDLKEGKSVQIPIFDWKTKKRNENTEILVPCSIIILEGIHTFHDETIFKQLNYTIFVDLNDEIREKRRIMRDVKDRRPNEAALIQDIIKYMANPIYHEFVEKHKNRADRIIETDKTEKEIEEEVNNIAKEILNSSNCKN